MVTIAPRPRDVEIAHPPRIGVPAVAALLATSCLGRPLFFRSAPRRTRIWTNGPARNNFGYYSPIVVSTISGIARVCDWRPETLSP